MQYNAPNCVAGGDILPFRFVAVGSANNTLVAQTGGAGPVAGVSYYFTKAHDGTIAAASGDPITLQCGPVGVAEIEAGEPLSVGDLVVAGTGGKAFKHDDEDWIHGQVLQAASGDGAKVRILVFNATTPAD